MKNEPSEEGEVENDDAMSEVSNKCVSTESDISDDAMGNEEAAPKAEKNLLEENKHLLQENKNIRHIVDNLSKQLHDRCAELEKYRSEAKANEPSKEVEDKEVQVNNQSYAIVSYESANENEPSGTWVAMILQENRTLKKKQRQVVP